MAALTASPPTMSPPSNPSTTSPPSLPPLMTSSRDTSNTPRRTASQRATSWVSQRMSSYSRNSHQHTSRPVSTVFPAFHSSLPYALVRDFAYPANHPMHYGPPPTPSGVSTPASEARRLSDPVVASWEDSRFHWSATPPWMSDSQDHDPRHQLPAMTFNDGGPPYSEDEDLHSPIVTTSRHKKHKSVGDHERGRSPGDAPSDRRLLLSSAYNPDEVNGPGGAIENYPHPPRHRDSNFAKPLQRQHSPYDGGEPMSEEDYSEDDETRYSKDYSFTIASPDEEMHGKAVALFDFESEHENELPLKEGQVVLVSYRHGQGWLVAEDPVSKESGLIPEEFVRLVRDIEGGLNGLNAFNLDEDSFSPVSNDPGSASTPTPAQQEFPRHSSKASGGSNAAVQSTFSTSSRDFSPYPLGKNEDSASHAPPARLSESS